MLLLPLDGVFIWSLFSVLARGKYWCEGRVSLGVQNILGAQSPYEVFHCGRAGPYDLRFSFFGHVQEGNQSKLDWFGFSMEP